MLEGFPECEGKQTLHRIAVQCRFTRSFNEDEPDRKDPSKIVAVVTRRLIWKSKSVPMVPRSKSITAQLAIPLMEQFQSIVGP